MKSEVLIGSGASGVTGYGIANTNEGVSIIVRMNHPDIFFISNLSFFQKCISYKFAIYIPENQGGTANFCMH